MLFASTPTYRIPTYRILADRDDGEIIECFIWRRSPEEGIERAKRDAVDFGFDNLSNFRAEPVAERTAKAEGRS